MPSLKFHQELYSRRALDEAVTVFAEIASSELSDARPYYVVKLESLDDSEDGHALPDLLDEFSNYVLGLTIEERRSAL